jgi:thiamine-phosphate pyrophosphorylase
LERLVRTARTLERFAAGAKPLRGAKPPLPAAWLFTDPGRTPDPVAVAGRLPRGAGVVFRAFGEPGALETGLALAKVARRRGLVLLVGADAALASRIGAAGVHLPERLAHRAPALRRRRPGWLITAAAHSPRGLARATRLGVDAAFLSGVFASRSPSAGRPIGVVRLASLAHASRTPVMALGGVNDRTAPRLVGSGAAGLAAVDGWLES